MQVFKANGSEIHFETLGGNAAGPLFLWAHGWGQSHAGFQPLAQSFVNSGRHIMVDFPGFGSAPPPQTAWGTEDYADAMAAFLKNHADRKVIWVGHSFGCRVGLQIAARHPELIEGLFLIAAAGLKRKRPLHKQINLKARVALYKTLKKCIPLGVSEDWLKSKFGADDYKNASGTMRGVFVKVVNEDLTAAAQKISCPVTLVYGTNDTETPLEIGERLHALIKNSRLVTLEGQDHYSVLGAGRYQAAHALQEFIESI